MTFFGNQISEDEKRRRVMNSLGQVFQRTTRILTGKPVTVKVVDLPNDPNAAWTVQDGQRTDCIHFNLPHVGSLVTAQDIVRMTGLNHHESAHVWFTPPIPQTSRHPIGAVFMDLGDNAYNAFNILEDQRIESMMVARYPSIRHYYTAAVTGYILSGDEDALKTAWMLVHGRRYLGSKLIDGLRQMFEFPELADEIAQIIDDYRKLNLYQHGDQVRAARLIRRLVRLMYEDMPKGSAPNYSHSTTYKYAPSDSEDKDNAEKASAGVRQGKDDRDQIKEQEKADASGGGQDDDEDEDDGSGGGGDDDDSDSEEDEEDESEDGGGGDDDGDGEDDADSDDEGEDSDSEDDGDDGEQDASDDPSEGSGGNSAGGGTDPVDRSAIQQIAEAIADLQDEAMNDDQVKAEVKRSQDAIKNAKHLDTVGRHHGWVDDTRPDVVNTAKRFAQKLDRIRTDLDPGWETHEMDGRLNVRRAMHGDPLGDVWDRWDEGKTDTTDIEMVALVDVSGSMGSHIRMLSDSTWAIKHSADKLRIACTVYAYDHTAYLVYSADDKAQPGKFPSLPATGGTKPGRAVVEAARILAASKRKKKLFIVMTDGEWDHGSSWYASDPESNSLPHPDEVIAEMNGAKVLTSMVYLKGAYDVYRRGPIDWHNTQVHAEMKDLTGFTPFADMLVRQLMRR